MTRIFAFLRRRRADDLRERHAALVQRLRLLTWQRKPRADVERDLRAVVVERLRRGL